MPDDTSRLLAYRAGDRQSYLDARRALMDAEHARRLDAPASERASALEKRASEILAELRAAEWQAFAAKRQRAQLERTPSITSPGLNHPRRHLVQETGDTNQVEQPNDLLSSPISALAPCDHKPPNGLHADEQYDFHLYGQPREDEVYRGMGVFQAKRSGLLGESSSLYRLFKSVPKGGDLHCHFEGSVDPDLYLHFAATTPELYLSSDRPLHTSAELYQAGIQFKVIHPDKWGTNEEFTRASQSIWSEHYVAHTWVPAALARDTFPHPDTYEAPVITARFRALDRLQHAPAPGKFGPKQDAFDAWLHSRLTMTPHAYVAERQTSLSAWAHFSSTFSVISGLINYEPNFRAAAKRVMLDHILDGVPYMEVRANFLPKSILATDMQTELPHTEWCRIWLEVEAEVKAEVAEANRSRSPDAQLFFHAAKLIFTTIRFVDCAALRESMEDCLKCKEAYPDLIVGFDLVGHEDPGTSLREYLPELLWFTEQVKQRGWWDPSRPDSFDAMGEESLPFLFHAGETLESGGPADNNLYDAILLGTRRIGHGFSLHKHPLLMELVREKGILVECCPISNEILRFTDTLASHPVVDFIANGLPISLASDDCTQFGNTGLTPDLYFTFMSLENVSLITLREITRQSFLHARMKPATKKRLLAQLDARWERFWQLVLDQKAL